MNYLVCLFSILILDKVLVIICVSFSLFFLFTVISVLILVQVELNEKCCFGNWLK